MPLNAGKEYNLKENGRITGKEMKNILVIGAARSGIAASRLMNQHGYQVTLTDIKPIENKEELEQEGITVYDNGHPDLLKTIDYDFVIKNPGIPYRAPLIQHFLEKKTPIYTEIETAYQIAPELGYAAVTGTDGKTTITTLLWEMLKAKDPNAQAAGNIGTPLSETVMELDGTKTDVALELSNFQLLGIDTFRPHISVVSNLAPDHLDYMDSLDAYYRSKFRIYENCLDNDWFILNEDDPLICEYAKNIPCQVITFSLVNPDADLHRDEKTVWFQDVPLFEIKDLKLVGDFNLGNAMMAACMAFMMGVSPQQISNVIKTFLGVEHRIEYAGEINGVRIYNDSKATNTHSAEAALSSFPKNIRLLAGGKDKGIDYSVLKKFDDAVIKCYSFGEIQDKFADIFSRQVSCTTMENALDAALQDAKPGDVILLCPATSSFDQFPNYEERGRIFKKLVHERMAK